LSLRLTVIRNELYLDYIQIQLIFWGYAGYLIISSALFVFVGTGLIYPISTDITRSDLSDISLMS